MTDQSNGCFPRFAVCLAAYNGMAYIVEQIESILLQKNVAVQIFISVDQSTDGTEDYLTEWALSESRLTLLTFGQRFGGAGPNFYRLLREVDLTGFEYLSLSDQDDLWHPEKLWRAHSLMTAQNAAGYSSNFTAFWPAGRLRLVNKAWPQRTWDFLFESAGPGCTYVLHSSLAIPLQKLVRNANKRLLSVDYHDWLAYAFARSHNFPWVIDSWSSMQYRQHAHNQIGVNAGWRSFWLRVRKILNGYGFEQSLLIADLVQASSLPVVQQGLRSGRSGYLWLALRATQCRRKRIDQLWFFISCVLLAMIKPAGRGEV
jgi:rhamnosyltransferase